MNPSDEYYLSQPGFIASVPTREIKHRNGEEKRKDDKTGGLQQ